MTEEKHHEHTEHHPGHTGHHEHKEHHHEHKVHHHTEHHAEHKPKGVGIKKSVVWQIATALAVLLLIISIATGGFGVNKTTPSEEGVETISAEEAAEKAVDYINNNLLQPGTSAELNGVSESNGVYSIDITVGGGDYTSYVSLDGKLLFVSGVDMTAEVEEPEIEPETPQEVVKSDKPEVELFVMSHCPYGTQAEKGIIPAVKALGDSIDFKIRFVYYAMHGETEVTEQTNQYCIQKEQNDKYLDYLECFLTEGDGAGCVESVSIDKDKLDTCVEAADEEFEITANLEDEEKWLNGRFPLFNTDAELNTKYGVGGSPTLVINGASVLSSRDSASYLSTICDHFNEAPEECNEELSSASPSAGFGYTTTSGASTTAQCG